MKKFHLILLCWGFFTLHATEIFAQKPTPMMPETGRWSAVFSDPGPDWTKKYPLPDGKMVNAPVVSGTNWPIGKRNVWMTRELSLAASYKLKNLHVKHMNDQNMWLYINGVLVYKSGKALEWNSATGIQNPLKPGKNTIAVRCENVEGPGKVVVGLYTDTLPVPEKIRGGGEILASGGADGTIRTWDAAYAKPLQTFTGHQGEVFGVEFSPDGKTLYSVSADRTIRVWETLTGELQNTIEASSTDIKSMAVSPDGTLLYTGNLSKVLKVWDTKTWDNITLPDDPSVSKGAGLISIRVRPQGDGFAAAAAWDIGIYDSKSNARFSLIRNSGSSGTSYTDSTGRTYTSYSSTTYTERLAFSSDGKVIGHTHRNCLLFHTLKGQQLFRMNADAADSGLMYQLAAIPNSPNFVVGCANGDVLIVNYQSQEIVRRVRAHEVAVSAVAVTPDGSKFATASSDTFIKIWDTPSGKLLNTLEGHRGIIRWLTFSPEKSDFKTVLRGGASSAGETAEDTSPQERDESDWTEMEKRVAKAFDYLLVNQEKLAVSALQKVAEEDEKDFQANNVLGMLYLTKLNKPEEAYKHLQKCTKTGAKNPSVLNNFGVAAVIMKKYGAALQAWELLAQMEPNSPELVQNIGLFMASVKEKRMTLKDEDEHQRLVDLYLEVCYGENRDYDPERGFLLLPLKTRSGNRPDCAKFFVQEIKKGRDTQTGEPYEVKRGK